MSTLPPPGAPPAARPRWQDRALCDGADPDLFFPEPWEDATAGKRICAACPVIADCLNWALATGQQWGTWGGMAEAERQDIATTPTAPFPRRCDAGLHVITGANQRPGGGCRACNREACRRYGKRARKARAAA